MTKQRKLTKLVRKMISPTLGRNGSTGRKKIIHSFSSVSQHAMELSSIQFVQQRKLIEENKKETDD